jgi:UDP:flavonoid glycosyltransferase YjiC (YdhE family)
MSRFLFAWELGQGFGHVGEMLPVARLLRDHGHEVVFAVRSFAVAEPTLGAEGFRYVAAPFWEASEEAVAAAPLIENFAHMLLHSGYAAVESLTGLIGAWRDVFQSVEPDFLVADHAPTALLAAHAQGLRRAAMGIGFYFPGSETPFPSMRPWRPTSPVQLEAVDRVLLETVNDALAAHYGAPLAALPEMLDCEAKLLCTLPELDHYGPREHEHYRGPIYTKMFGRGPDWPDMEGKRIFAFLHADLPHFDNVFRHVKALGLPCFAYVRGASEAQISAIQCDAIRVTAEPIDLAAVIASCDALICNGGHATIAAATLAGRPMMLIPHNVEQVLMAHWLGLGKSALPVGVGTSDEVLGQLVAQLGNDAELAAAAAAIAARHEGHDMDKEVAEIVARLEGLL